ncbi:SMP-30/gluconolactonase/LRE family protein [Terasakiella sp. SH-1]|uniref:SMP-30/gluconolactonase/LRE family protein n=1 Tax=Terasakiella sp. SH-1 TaxID=2560057 RepID=UPI00107320D0|nr:SMP-30/gluconolactonase/LRE family protein [Terasakiella sp. SH-1]
MKCLQAELLVGCHNELGGGIQWNGAEQRLYWTDIQNKHLYSCDEFGHDLMCYELEERLCSFAFDLDGKILAAFASGLYRLDIQSGQRDLLYAYETHQPATRLNDGRCDRQGRFIVGGYYEAGPEAITHVLSFGKGEATSLFDGVKCANSICFSPCGTRMYFADTETREIASFTYAPDSGCLSQRSSFAQLSEEEGLPDGSCIDREGGLWNAQYNGACVQRFLADGTRDIIIKVPALNVTCCCFGGKNLDKLFITTARQEMDTGQLVRYPQSGGAFVVKPGIIGLAESLYQDRLFA